jgi:hypothetical protein
VIDEDVWLQPAVGKKLPPDASKRIGFSDYITGGRVVFADVIQGIYDDINERFGSSEKPPL